MNIWLPFVTKLKLFLHETMTHRFLNIKDIELLTFRHSLVDAITDVLLNVIDNAPPSERERGGRGWET